MKRYKELKYEDIIKGYKYECICLIGNNPDPWNLMILYDIDGKWHLKCDGKILTVCDESVMNILKKHNKKRHEEILKGESYEDTKYKSLYSILLT